MLVIFTLQNNGEITLHFFFWDISNVPLVVVLLGCIVIGYIIAVIYFSPRLWKLRKELKQMIKFNKELKELHSLNHPKKKVDDKNSFFKD